MALGTLKDKVTDVIYIATAVVGWYTGPLVLGQKAVCPFTSWRKNLGTVWRILLLTSKPKSEPGVGRGLPANKHTPCKQGHEF